MKLMSMVAGILAVSLLVVGPIGADAQTPEDPCASFRDGSPSLPDSEDLYRQCQGIFNYTQSSDDPWPVIVIGGAIAAVLFIFVPIMVFVVVPMQAFLDNRRDRRERPWAYIEYAPSEPVPTHEATMPAASAVSEGYIPVRPDGYPVDWEDRKRRVYRRDGYRCRDCDANCGPTGVRPDCHHVVPMFDGGSHEFFNLVTLCRPCHDRRHLLISAERREMRRQFRRSQFEWSGEAVAAVIMLGLLVAWFVAYLVLR